MVRVYPFLANLYIFVGSLIKYYHIDYKISVFVYTSIGCSFFLNIILWKLSKKMRFCFWYRMLLLNLDFYLILETLFNYGIEISYFSKTIIISTILSIFIAGINTPKMEHKIQKMLVSALEYLIRQTKKGCCDNLTGSEYDELIEALKKIKNVYDRNNNVVDRRGLWAKYRDRFRSLLQRKP